MAEKETTPIEVSIKYMAWNIKEMSESMKKIVLSLEAILSIKREKVLNISDSSKKASDLSHDEFSF